MDGKTIGLPSELNTFVLWNIRTGKKRKKYSGYLNEEKKDGLTGFDGGYSWVLLNHMNKRTSIAVSPDGEMIAKGYIDSTVIILNTETGKIKKRLNYLRSQIR